MKKLFLFIFLFTASLSLAQNDSLRITFTNPTTNADATPLTDADSTIFSYLKVHNPTDTLRFAAMVFGDESWEGIAPDTGLTKYFVQVKDTNGNISAYSIPDTVTIRNIDNVPPAAPTSYVAIGGTASDQYVSTWTEPAGDETKVYFYAYEGYTTDTLDLVLIDSLNAGVETYTYTGLTQSTTYTSAVKIRDALYNYSAFSNLDTATTIASGGGGLPDPVWQVVYDTEVTADANNKVTVWATQYGSNDYDLVVYGDTDTTLSFLDVDSALYANSYSVDDAMEYLDDAVGNPFDFGTSDFTIEMWVYPYQIAAVRYLIAKWAAPHYYVAINNLQVDFGVLNGANPSTYVVLPTAELWYHIVISADRDDDLVMYVNGDSTESNATTDWTDEASTDIDNTSSFSVANRYDGDSNGAVAMFKRISIYDNAFTTSQVQTLYGEGKP